MRLCPQDTLLEQGGESMMKRSLPLVLAGALVVGCGASSKAPDYAMLQGLEDGKADDVGSIPRFHRVTNDLYRGGRPEDSGLSALAAAGIKTVIDLEDEEAAVAAETVTAASLGMSFVSKPMSSFFAPRDQQ